MKHLLNFYTSYNQFYVFDKGSDGNMGSVTFWDEAGFNDRLAIGEGVLGVGTECYGPVKGELNLLIKENLEINIDDYDHIVEAGVEIKSGVIQILECPNSTIELEINVDPGFYRVRVYSSNLASVDGDEGDDFYKLEIWPGKNMLRSVLKRYDR